ncbi:MAG: hypothetical protein AB1797_11520 [bacterium]
MTGIVVKFLQPDTSVQYRVSSIEDRASRIKYRASSIEYYIMLFPDCQQKHQAICEE